MIQAYSLPWQQLDKSMYAIPLISSLIQTLAGSPGNKDQPFISPPPIIDVNNIKKEEQKLSDSQVSKVEKIQAILLPIDEIAEKIRQKRIISREEAIAITLVIQREYAQAELKSKCKDLLILLSRACGIWKCRKSARVYAYVVLSNNKHTAFQSREKLLG